MAATIEPLATEVQAATEVRAVMGVQAKVRWGMTIDLRRCTGCQSCTMACKVENGTPPGIFWMRVVDREEGTFPMAFKIFMPLRCNHCMEPPCVPVCPTGASYQRQKDNLVLIDQDKCIGCRACVVACPYQVRFVADNRKGYYDGESTPYETSRYAKWQAGTAQKCTFCVDRIDAGLSPMCVATCPAKALTIGDLNDPQSEISKLLRARPSLQPRAELGTDASLYYLT